MSLFLENYLCYSEIFQVSTLYTLWTITKQQNLYTYPKISIFQCYSNSDLHLIKIIIKKKTTHNYNINTYHFFQYLKKYFFQRINCNTDNRFTRYKL